MHAVRTRLAAASARLPRVARSASFAAADAVPVTCADAASIDKYNLALHSFFAGDEDPVPVLDEGVVHDASFFAGIVLQGWFNAHVHGHAFDSPSVKRAIDTVDRYVRTGNPITHREAALALALSSCSRGHPYEACAFLEGVLAQDPHDLLVLRLLADTYLALGDTRNHMRCCERVLPFWSSSVPGFHHVLAVTARARAHAGAFDRAEAAGMLALDMDATEILAIGALGGAFVDKGDPRRAIRLLGETRDLWEKRPHALGPCARAYVLALLETGATNKALTQYRLWIAPQALRRLNLPASAAALTTATAVLLRVHVLGGDVSGDWDELVAAWGTAPVSHAGAGASLQALFHRAVACLRAGDAAALGDAQKAAAAAAESAAEASCEAAPFPYPVADAEAWALPRACVVLDGGGQAGQGSGEGGGGAETGGETAEQYLGRALGSCRPLPLSWSPLSLDPALGLRTPHVARAAQLVLGPAVEGIAEAAQGREGAACDRLVPLAGAAAALGGDSLLADSLHLLAADLAIGSGDLVLARRLVDDRIGAREESPFEWELLGQWFDAAGDAAGAEQARDRAAQLGFEKQRSQDQ